MKMLHKRVLETMGIILLTFFLSWLIPPVIQKLRHLCPVRPDGLDEVQAMPMFARRLGVNCTTCHTTFPRLNKVGYMFRRAGYRMPDEIGKDIDDKDLSHYMAMRGKVRYVYQDSRQGKASGTPVTKTKSGFGDSEVTFYPLTNSFNKNYSSLFELSIAPEEELTEIENAYLKGTWGKPDLFYTVKGGVFHMFEGYGASDRPIGSIRPAFQTIPAFNGTQSTLFGPWTNSDLGFGSIDQLGIESGLSWKDSHLTLTLFNGIASKLNDETGNLEPKSIGKDISIKDAGKLGVSGLNDVQLFFNQFIGEGAVSLYYYNGQSTLQDPKVSTATWMNSFQRFALYANYPVLKQLEVLAGYQRGKDDRANHVDNGAAFMNKYGISQSEGYFLGLESQIIPRCTLTARIDYFDPEQDRSAGIIRTGTFAFVFLPVENMRYSLDYQYKSTDLPAEKIGNNLFLEWQWFF